MGVTKLWQLLEDCGEGEMVCLSQCAGEKWAVDLSGWMVPARTAVSGGHKTVSAVFSMVRTVFFRALCLLKNGIQPVFVMDGKTAPTVKSQTLQERSQRAFSHTKEIAHNRTGLVSKNSLCEDLIKSLGLQVITSQGEAEKTCALLNCQGIVDACLSDDSDIFLYGATTVYRNLDLKKKKVEKHTTVGIERELKVTARELVVVALLAGCDYGRGVKGMGPKKSLNLTRAIKVYCPDVLTRVCGWRNDEQVLLLDQQQQQLKSMKKERHCTQCRHPGMLVQHKSAGCSICSTQTDCKSDSGIPCTCAYDKLQGQLASVTEELDVRHKALACDTFPNIELVKEYTEGRDVPLEISQVQVTIPRYENLFSILRFKKPVAMKHIIPVLFHMHLYGTICLPQAKPIRIVKTCKRNFVSCYLMKWEHLDFDKWTEKTMCSVDQTPPAKQDESSDVYTVAMPCPLVSKILPELVKNFEETTSTKKGKRPEKHSSQTTLTNFFQVKKAKRVLEFGTEDNQPSA